MPLFPIFILVINICSAKCFLYKGHKLTKWSSCLDIDECDKGEHSCDVNAGCADTDIFYYSLMKTRCLFLF